MNWAQFKDPVSHMCLASTVVASWSFTQDVAGSNPFTVMTNIFVSECSEFSDRVPTQPGKPGKPGKMRVHLENLEISWNFEKFNKNHGKMT